jgi:hypothetical protein
VRNNPASHNHGVLLRMVAVRPVAVQNLGKRADLRPAALRSNLPLAKLLVNSLRTPIESPPHKGVAGAGRPSSLFAVAG